MGGESPPRSADARRGEARRGAAADGRAQNFNLAGSPRASRSLRLLRLAPGHGAGRGARQPGRHAPADRAADPRADGRTPRAAVALLSPLPAAARQQRCCLLNVAAARTAATPQPPDLRAPHRLPARGGARAPARP